MLARAGSLHRASRALVERPRSAGRARRQRRRHGTPTGELLQRWVSPVLQLRRVRRETRPHLLPASRRAALTLRDTPAEQRVRGLVNGDIPAPRYLLATIFRIS